MEVFASSLGGILFEKKVESKWSAAVVVVRGICFPLSQHSNNTESIKPCWTEAVDEHEMIPSLETFQGLEI